MIIIFMRRLILRRTSKVVRRTNPRRGFISSTTQRKTFQPMNLFSLTRYIRRPRHFKSLFVLLMRITRTSPHSYKDILLWYCRLENIGLQHVQWLIITGRLKIQGNSKAVENCERHKCASCEFEKGSLSTQQSKENPE